MSLGVAAKAAGAEAAVVAVVVELIRPPCVTSAAVK